MPDHIESPSVSIIIVNFNGIKFIESCLESVLNTDYPNFEVVFVDNASSDGSLELVREKFASKNKVKIVANKYGLGPAKGRNIGINESRGKYIAFLDNDTEVDKNWLKALVNVLKADDTIGAAQSKILLSDKKTIDTCGHYLSVTGFPYEIGTNEYDSGQYNSLIDIFGARSAAMFIRRDILDNIGYFDPDYFMHGEETDLSWRVWLNNYRVVYVPDSVVYHKKGGSLNTKSRYLIFYEGSKNCTKTLIKNLGLKRLLLILPMHILGWIVVSASLILKRRFNESIAIIRGLFWDLCNIKRILNDRKVIQHKRLSSDSKIMPIIMGNYNI